MQYSKIVRCYDGSADLDGRTIQAFHSQYSFAVFRLDNGEIMSFAVEEISVGKWFEVFPLRKYPLNQDYPFAWSELVPPFTVASGDLLWREEWLESASDTSMFLGSGPHSVQFADVLGAAPKSNPNVIKVLAGLRLVDQNGRVLAISSSDNTPFKIDLATTKDEVDQIMRSRTAENV